MIHDSYGVRVTNDGKYFLQYQARLNQVSNMFGTAFMALTNNHPDLPPRFENFTTHPWIMQEWFIHTPINHVNSKTQQIIDRLSAIEQLVKMGNNALANKDEFVNGQNVKNVPYVDKYCDAYTPYSKNINNYITAKTVRVL